MTRLKANICFIFSLYKLTKFNNKNMFYFIFVIDKLINATVRALGIYLPCIFIIYNVKFYHKYTTHCIFKLKKTDIYNFSSLKYTFILYFYSINI